MEQYRVVAKVANGFLVVGITNTKAQAERMADRYMFSLDPDTDECPEMMIETVRKF